MAGATMSQNGSQPTSGSDPRSSGTQISAATPVTSQQDKAMTHGAMSSAGTAAWEVCGGTTDVGMVGASAAGLRAR